MERISVVADVILYIYTAFISTPLPTWMKAKADRTSLRVVKTLSPSDRGAKGLAERYGDALLCVRHRLDVEGKFRFVTVEILVDRKPVKPRIDRTVGVRIELHERALRSLVITAGATWDAEKRLWRMSKRLAGVLKLGHRIIEK